MEIVNRHSVNGAWPSRAIYVGRGTPLGNPYVIGEHGDRDEVIDQYAAWLDWQIQVCNPVVLTALAGLREDSILVCSCAPLRCHAEVIAQRWVSFMAEGGIIKPAGITMSYAGIGSRETPDPVIRLMGKIAEWMEKAGFTMRSGGANGADSAFEAGCAKHEIYLPWPGFNGRTSSLNSVSTEAMQIASAVHPAFTYLSQAAKKLMGRNTYQVMGKDLKTLSDFVVCWTPDAADCEAKRGRRTGGTGQAIALASRWHVPVFNLAEHGASTRLKEYASKLIEG